jgi:hypothetical protein
MNWSQSAFEFPFFLGLEERIKTRLLIVPPFAGPMKMIGSLPSAAFPPPGAPVLPSRRALLFVRA